MGNVIVNKYNVDGVYLFVYAGCVEEVRIDDVAHGFIKTKYGWMSLRAWESRKPCKIGRVRRFLGFPIGVIRD